MVDLWAWTAIIRAGGLGSRLIETALALLGLLLPLVLATVFSRSSESSSVGDRAMTQNLAGLTFFAGFAFSSVCWALALISLQSDPGSWPVTFLVGMIATLCGALSGLFDPARFRANSGLASATARKRRITAVRRKFLHDSRRITSSESSRLRDYLQGPPWQWCCVVGLVLFVCTALVRNSPVAEFSLLRELAWFAIFATLAWVGAATCQVITVGIWLGEYKSALASAYLAIFTWLLIPLLARLSLMDSFEGRRDLLYVVCLVGPLAAWMITHRLSWPRTYLARKLVEREKDENRAIADLQAAREANRLLT